MKAIGAFLLKALLYCVAAIIVIFGIVGIGSVVAVVGGIAFIALIVGMVAGAICALFFSRS